MGGAAAAELGYMSTSTPVSVAEAAAAVTPSAVLTVTSGEEEAARVATADAVGAMVLS